MKKQFQEFKKPTKAKQIIVLLFFYISLFGGLLASVIAAIKFENYDNPYLFGLTFGTLGLISGFLVGRKIKPYVILNLTMNSNYLYASFLFSFGFIGSFLLIGHYINLSLSKLDYCANYIILNKELIRGGRHTVSKNILVLSSSTRNTNILCDLDYWNNVKIGQKVNLCYYESLIGFNYSELTNNK